MNPLPALSPARAVVYVRVSSHEQASDGFGLQAQASACRDFALRESLTVCADAVDSGVSGTVLMDERPGLSKALALCWEYGAGTLLIYARDRLARDPYVAGDAKRAFAANGVRLLYVEGGNGGDDSDLLLDDIQHAISAHERRRIIARLAAGRQLKAREHPNSRAQGGSVPIGYRRAKSSLVISPSDAGDVCRIFSLVIDGQPLRQVAETMTTETGRKWTAATIANIIRRPIYKQAEPGRIVDPRIWNRAQEAMDRRRRRY